MQMPGRKYTSATQYRYGFNGKEEDDEVSGDGNQYDYGFRIYNPRIGRFLSVDPLTNKYPELSPYQFASNMPIIAIDLDGEEAKIVTIFHSSSTGKEFYRTVQDLSTPFAQIASSTLTIHKYAFSTKKGLEWKQVGPAELTFNRPINFQTGRIDLNEQTFKSLMSPFVKKLVNKAIDTEAGYVNNPNDPGGATKYGIAENREWPRAAKFLGLNTDPQNIKTITREQAQQYYIASRIEPYRINDIKNERVANAILDQSVLTPGLINKNVKRSLNDLGYNFEVNSNKLTDEQIDALNKINPDIFVEKFTDHQLEHYESIKKTNRSNYDEHIHGWKNRLNKL